jgi:GH25 family lysozyme M1 (1,4-beta-N-acetylmuramidase)
MTKNIAKNKGIKFKKTLIILFVFVLFVVVLFCKTKSTYASTTINLSHGTLYTIKNYYKSSVKSYNCVSSDSNIVTVSKIAKYKNPKDKKQYYYCKIRAKNIGEVVITESAKNNTSIKTNVIVQNRPTIADLSTHQGVINWNKASTALDLAILRVQYNGNIKKWEHRYLEYSTMAKLYNVPFGVYAYDVFKTKKQAKKMAKAFVKNATQGGRKPLFFILDAEVSYIKKQNVATYISTVRNYAKKIYPNKRVKVGVYVANHLYKKLKLNLNVKSTANNTPDFVWIPKYTKNNNGNFIGTAPKYKLDMWQYTSTGSVYGINGKVDLSTLVTTSGKKLSKQNSFSFEWLLEQ